jgi:hypothetical protein
MDAPGSWAFATATASSTVILETGAPLPGGFEDSARVIVGDW